MKSLVAKRAQFYVMETDMAGSLEPLADDCSWRER